MRSRLGSGTARHTHDDQCQLALSLGDLVSGRGGYVVGSEETLPSGERGATQTNSYFSREVSYLGLETSFQMTANSF